MTIADNAMNKKDELFNPFPGLRPFKIEESHLFFGREGQSEEILNKLSNEKFVAVIGTSGSGKSSLIYCGLVPVLYGGFIGDRNSNWRIITTRPGNSPIENLSAALIKETSENQGSTDDFIKQKFSTSLLRSSSMGLVESIKQSFDLTKENVLIIVDQFEELFRYKSSRKDLSTYNESEAFVRLLVSANKAKDVPIYIVLTMRSDFIGECSQFHELTELINDSNYLVPQMTRDDFKKAVEGPVAVGGAQIEPQLVQLLLNEVGDNSDQLPILQHALMRTWDYWTDHSDTSQPIGISDYEAIGKMEKALSEHANEAYDELAENQKWICESMFKTITEKGNDNRGIRHPTSIKNIASIAQADVEDVIKVVEPFRALGRSFITPSYEVNLNADSIIDLSHESLMRIWNKLKVWVEEEWNAVQMYMRLSEASEMFQLGKTGLWRPPDLQLALNWREKQKPTLAWAQRYNPAFERAMVYLETSDKDFKAEEENKVKLQKRQLRRTKVFAIVLGSAAIVAVALTLYSQSLKVEADRERKKAEEQKVIAEERKVEAEKQTKFAKDKEQEALEQKEEAEKARIFAEQKRLEAVRSADIAEKQRLKAQENQKIADSERARAEVNEKEARNQTVEAEKARQEAYRRRMLSIAQSMAVKSQQIMDNTQLKGLVAYQAYMFNFSNEGLTLNPDVYLGLYYALKAFKGNDFNAINGHTGSVMDIAFVPETNTLFTTGGDGKILKWNIEDLKIPFETIVENPFVQRAIAVTPDSKYMICGTDDSKIQLFSLTNSVSLIKDLTGHTSIIVALAVSGDSKFFISVGNDKTIRKWDLTSFNNDILLQIETKINSLKITPDNKQVIIGTQDGKILLFDIESKTIVKTIFEESKNAITAFAYNHSGKWMVSGDSKGNIKIWDTKNYTLIETLEGHRSRIYDIDFSPDDELVASTSLDGTVRMWDCGNINNQPVVLTDHESWVLSIAFSPDGKRLITSSNQKERILVWSTTTEQMAKDLKPFLERNMTTDEWNVFVAKDVDYEKTLSK
jgi:WD40 repeat protein